MSEPAPLDYSDSVASVSPHLQPLSSPCIDPIDPTDPGLMSITGRELLIQQPRRRSQTHHVGIDSSNTTRNGPRRRRNRTTTHHSNSSSTADQASDAAQDDGYQFDGSYISSLIRDESAPTSANETPSRTSPSSTAIEDKDRSLRQSRSVSFGTPVSTHMDSFDSVNSDIGSHSVSTATTSPVRGRESDALPKSYFSAKSTNVEKHPAASTPTRISPSRTLAATLADTGAGYQNPIEQLGASDMLRSRRVTIGSESRKSERIGQESSRSIGDDRDLRSVISKLRSQLGITESRNVALTLQVSRLTQALKQTLPDSPESFNVGSPGNQGDIKSAFDARFSQSAQSGYEGSLSPFVPTGSYMPASRSYNADSGSASSAATSSFSPFSPMLPSFQHGMLPSETEMSNPVNVSSVGLGFLDSPGPIPQASWPTLPANSIMPGPIPLPRPSQSQTAMPEYSPDSDTFGKDGTNSIGLYMPPPSDVHDSTTAAHSLYHTGSQRELRNTTYHPHISKPARQQDSVKYNSLEHGEPSAECFRPKSTTALRSGSFRRSPPSGPRQPEQHPLTHLQSSTPTLPPPLLRSTSDITSSGAANRAGIWKEAAPDSSAFAAYVSPKASGELSMILQQELKLGSEDRKLEIVAAIKLLIRELSDDKHGNFLVQRAIGVDPSIAWDLRGHFNKLSVSQFGCHVVQRVLDENENLKIAVVRELLAGDIKTTLRSRHSIHVWQKILEIDWMHRDFRRTLLEVINATMRGSWAETAMMETGSIVCQNIFESTDTQEKLHCLEEVLARIGDVAANQWGVWVVQHIIEHGDDYARRRALDKLIPDAVSLTLAPSGQKAIMSALKTGDSTFIKSYLDVLCDRDTRSTTGASSSRRSPLIEIASSPQGIQIVTQLVTTVSAEQRERIISTVRKNSVFLKGSRSGLKVHQLCERARAYTGY